MVGERMRKGSAAWSELLHRDRWDRFFQPDPHAQGFFQKDSTQCFYL